MSEEKTNTPAAQPVESAKRTRGRPPKVAREIAKEPIRETVREPVRSGTREVVGRDGKALSRKRGGNVDRFYIPPHIVPYGWTYEWKRESLFGQEDTAHLIHMQENGWRPVMAETHPGYFMPEGYKGAIRRDGLIMMERPAELTEEARNEERAAAKYLMEAQKEQLGLQLPKGFSGEHKGVQPRVRTSYEPADVGRPRIQISDE